MKQAPIAVDPLQGLRVLIIEDEAMLALCIGDIIESAGCIVVGMASTVADALQSIEATTFDVALLDLHLHGRSVEAVASAIENGGSAAVVSTGSDFINVPAELRHWPVLRKPYKDKELLDALASAARAR